MRDFESGREWSIVRCPKLGITNRRAWLKAYESGLIPLDIEKHPQSKYKGKGWGSWPDWLGKKIKPKRTWFKKGREMAHRLARKHNITMSSEWLSAWDAGLIPKSIRRSPNKSYRKQWVSWNDWLGLPDLPEWSFDDLWKWAREAGISGEAEWRRMHGEGKLPSGVPSSPARDYRGKGWVDWHHFLGKERPNWADRRKLGGKMPYKEAFSWAQVNCPILKIKNLAGWHRAYKEGLIPITIPVKPNEAYPEWEKESWFNVPLLTPFHEARRFSWASPYRKMGEWYAAYDAGLIPEGIPRDPRDYKEYSGYRDWLGVGVVKFEDGREFARNLFEGSNARFMNDWVEAYEEGLIPKGISKYPARDYDEWLGWADWFGVMPKSNSKIERKKKIGVLRKDVCMILLEDGVPIRKIAYTYGIKCSTVKAKIKGWGLLNAG